MHHDNESMEIIEQHTINKPETTDNFRRSIIKEKQQNTNFSFKSLLKRNKKQDHGPRTIYINQSHLNAQQNYVSNSVSTAKYNVVTFLPKFLFEEFSKSANIFFLFISGIQVSYFSWHEQDQFKLTFCVANSKYFTHFQIYNTGTFGHCIVDYSHQRSD